MFFTYDAEATEYLKKRDRQLGDAMHRIGPIHREVDEDLFSGVIRLIVGQQISAAAQATVWKRIADKLGTVSAEAICLCPRDELQGCGITFKKTDYILEFAGKVQSGSFDLEALRDMPDQEVIRKLSSLSGIGVWTAEMLMIFCMHRPDIVSYGDLAIHRGMRMLYHHRRIDRSLFEKYARRYSPYGTVASLYLWAIAGGAVPEMRDYAPKKKPKQK